MLVSTCIASLGAGYLAGGFRNFAVSAGEKANPAACQRPDRPGSRDSNARGVSSDELLSGVLKGRSVKELSDEELAKILVDLVKYDPQQDPVVRARRSYQYQLLLARLSPSQLERAAESIAADPENKRGGGLSAIVAALAAKDPQRALAWAKGRKNPSGLLSMVLEQMSKDNPMETAEIFRNGLLDDTIKLSGYNIFETYIGIGRAMAKLGKTPLLDFLDGLPMGYQNDLLSNTFRSLPESDRAEMLEEIQRRAKDGRLQDWNFTRAFSDLASVDPERAKAWLERMEPGKERALLGLAQVRSFAQNGDQEVAREWMAGAISQMEGKEMELLGEVINTVNFNPGGIAMFAEMLPAGVEIQAEDLKDRAINSYHQGFGGLVDLANVIRDPAEQAELITCALQEYLKRTETGSSRQSLNAIDFEILARRLHSLGLTGDNAAKVEQALANAKSAVPTPAK